MAHHDAHVDAAVAVVALLGRVLHLVEPQGLTEHPAETFRTLLRFVKVCTTQRVVVERNTVDDGHDKQRPMGSAVGALAVSAVVDGQEDVCCLLEVWERAADALEVDGLHEQERYARS